ncbi:uncharacterized protein B0T15DRAFT_514979 [Chaetomium strumarium]|uniref:Uncharacterized protein n=1 Tax=Chaetomium strumarium TaxID=1170767 RepID=A0AAJ0LXX0_9PEZI|nr:hypothetical protein B0T15DRAFT_514979 [Chaetomium strumarium]
MGSQDSSRYGSGRSSPRAIPSVRLDPSAGPGLTWAAGYGRNNSSTRITSSTHSAGDDGLLFPLDPEPWRNPFSTRSPPPAYPGRGASSTAAASGSYSGAPSGNPSPAGSFNHSRSPTVAGSTCSSSTSSALGSYSSLLNPYRPSTRRLRERDRTTTTSSRRYGSPSPFRLPCPLPETPRARSPTTSTSTDLSSRYNPNSSRHPRPRNRDRLRGYGTFDSPQGSDISRRSSSRLSRASTAVDDEPPSPSIYAASPAARSYADSTAPGYRDPNPGYYSPIVESPAFGSSPTRWARAPGRRDMDSRRDRSSRGYTV